jgi:hypothetical protein
MEQELRSNDTNNNDAWKTKYEELQEQMTKLKQDNELLSEENENLNRIIESMKKRMALK